MKVDVERFEEEFTTGFFFQRTHLRYAVLITITLSEREIYALEQAGIDQRAFYEYEEDDELTLYARVKSILDAIDEYGHATFQLAGHDHQSRAERERVFMRGLQAVKSIIDDAPNRRWSVEL